MKTLVLFAGALLAAASVPFPAAAATELLSNGDFEDGNFAGWTVISQPGSAPGTYIAQPGFDTPIETPTLPNPSGGAWYAIAAGDTGARVLVQSFTLPSTINSAKFSAQVFFSQASGYRTDTQLGLDYTTGPNQHALIDILKAGADPFSAAPEDIVQSFLHTAPSSTYGATPWLTFEWELLNYGFAPGETYQVRFAEVNNTGIFGIGVDNVSILTAVPEPSTWAMLLAGFAAVGAILRRRGQRMSASRRQLALASA